MSGELISGLFALSGVIVGAIISFYVSRAVEREKWRQERQEKFQEVKRGALADALEWIEPMRNAKNHASSLVRAAIRGDIDEEYFLNKFPYLLGEVEDLPAHRVATLSEEVYKSAIRIVREMDELRILGVKYGQEARLMNRPMAGLQECDAKINEISKQITDLDTYLREEYRKTFE